MILIVEDRSSCEDSMITWLADFYIHSLMRQWQILDDDSAITVDFKLIVSLSIDSERLAIVISLVFHRIVDVTADGMTFNDW